MAVKMVKVVNKTNSSYGLTLNDGNHIDLTQYIPGKETHISKPIEYNNLPNPVIKKGGIIARGELVLIDL